MVSTPLSCLIESSDSVTHRHFSEDGRNPVPTRSLHSVPKDAVIWVSCLERKLGVDFERFGYANMLISITI